MLNGNFAETACDRVVSRMLENRRLIPLGPDDLSQLDASRRWWNSLSPEKQGVEIQLLLAIAECSGSGGP